MYCTNCGNVLGEADRFCSQCGKANAPGPGPVSSTPPYQRPPFLRAMATKKIAGVCSGVARYLDIDPTLTRVLFVAGMFLHLSTGFLYILLWAVMSRDDQPPYAMPSAPRAA